MIQTCNFPRLPSITVSFCDQIGCIELLDTEISSSQRHPHHLKDQAVMSPLRTNPPPPPPPHIPRERTFQESLVGHLHPDCSYPSMAVPQMT